MKLLKRKLKYFSGTVGVDLAYLTRSTFWTTILYAINSLLSLASIYVIARYLPQDIYGTYKYLLALASSFSFLTLSGMNNALIREAAISKVNILETSVKIQLRWNMLYTIAVSLCAVYYAWMGNYAFALCLALLAIFPAMQYAYNTYGAYLTGKQRIKENAVTSIIVAITSSLSILFTILLTDNLVWIMTAYCLGSFIPTFYFYRMINAELKSKPAGEESITIKGLLQYARHLTFISAMPIVAAQVDKISIFQLVGPKELALYSIALAVPERIKGYVKSLALTFMPRLSKRDIGNIHRVFYTRVIQTLVIGFLIAAAYYITVPLVFQYIIPNYVDALPYARGLAITVAFAVVTTYTSNIFRAQKMIREIYYSSIFGHLSRIIVYPFLVFFFGTWGIIYALTAVYVIGFAQNIYLFERFARKQLIKTDAKNGTQ